MQWFLILTALLLLGSTAMAEEGFHVYSYTGYADTPVIPGSQYVVHQDDRPLPPRVVVAPSDCEADPPSDAIVLFDGASLDAFAKNEWTVENGIMTAGHGDIETRRAFGDCQLHLEWRAPDPPTGEPANMGNSGVYLMKRYEVQIYDSYSSRIYADGSAAAVYGQTPPLVNATRPPGEWQTYDILFTAPVYDGDRLLSPARLTMLHNGVLVHNNTTILGATGHRTLPDASAHAPRLPLLLQGHGSPVAFRNVWIRDLEDGRE